MGFSNTNNQLIYETAQRFGFNVNYQGTNGSNIGAIRVGGHNNHGYLDYGLPPVTIRTKKQKTDESNKIYSIVY